MQDEAMQQHVVFERDPDGNYIYRARITASERIVYEEQKKWAEDVEKKKIRNLRRQTHDNRY